MNEPITSDTSDQFADPNLNSRSTGGLQISVKAAGQVPTELLLNGGVRALTLGLISAIGTIIS